MADADTSPKRRPRPADAPPAADPAPTPERESRDAPPRPIRPRQRLGKYRVLRRLAHGGFATVWEALDTIEGVKVALKVPHAESVTPALLEDFRREVRFMARLDHPNILPLKSADMIDGHLVLAHPVADGTLEERMQRRLSTSTALSYGEQLLAALAHAHAHRIIHCDVKPENLLLFPGKRLRLTDFGIAKVSQRTRTGSGSGTVGYLAPEQAMGRPSFRSDVFSAGLILYRMLAGVVPRWPFAWPFARHERLERRVPAAMVEVVRRAIEVDEHQRYRDAQQMLEAFRRARKGGGTTKRRKAARAAPRDTVDWKSVRARQFLREHGKALDLRLHCTRCGGKVSEAMLHCPWCTAPRKRLLDDVSFPARCPRCRRGCKLDWTYCAWCHGPAIGPLTERSWDDKRYTARCSAPGCKGRLMPFMRYCPWCRHKVRRAWRVPGTRERCSGCGWGVSSEYWTCCPWCGRALQQVTSRGR